MNPKIYLPYGKRKLEIDCSEKFQLLQSKMEEYQPDAEAEELIQRSLNEPIGSPSLKELSRGKKKVVILASDHTRPVPSRLIMPQLLSEIRKGNIDAEITILIATGCHRGTTETELIEKFGEKIVKEEKIIIHDCDISEMKEFGELPSGGKLYVNRIAAEADLLLAEGFIEPHFFAGFSGGRKSVLPGIADRKTVLYNHNGAFIASPFARTGVLDGNPIHEDMEFAAKKVGLSFICNVVLNERKEIVYVVSGEPAAAHRKGCSFLEKICRVSSEQGDIVITTNGGYPLDQNIYQAVKAMTAAEEIVKKDGVIIMAAACEDGHGGDGFFKTFREEKNLSRMTEKFIKTKPEKTIVDQWQSQILARVLKKARVVFISEVPDEIVKEFQMEPAHSLQEALEKAEKILKRKPEKIILIPDGVSVITSVIS